MSATQEGADVLRIGQNEIGITIAVVYPMLIETYTFLKSQAVPRQCGPPISILLLY